MFSENNKIILNKFKNKFDLNIKFKNDLLNLIKRIFDNKKEINLVIPGGDSIKEFYEIFFKENLDWNRFNISLTDERWVHQSSKKSNENLIYSILKKNLIDKKNFFPLKGNSKDIDTAIKINNSKLAKLLPIDILILGMGIDGHTASLFREDQNLINLLSSFNSNITGMAKHENLNRITLTQKSLISAKNKFLYINGTDKLKTLESALDKKSSDYYPIYNFLKSDISIYWSEK